MLGWELPPHNSGGLGVACYHMAKALAGAGAAVSFVLPYKAYHPKTSFMKIYPATKLDPLHRMGMGAYDTAISEDTPNDNQSAAAPVTVRAIQRRYVEFIKQHVINERPDVIHAHDWLTFEAGVAAKQATGVPLVVHVHATEFDRAGNAHGNPLIHEIEYQGLVAADRIIAVSDFTKRLIVRRYHIPEDKIEVVHNSIDTDTITAVEQADTYRYVSSLRARGHLVVSTLGRLTLQKGLHHFLRGAAKACSVYDRFVFIVAGDGEQRNELIQLSADLGISDKVIFTGFVRGQRWRDVYAVSDVFVMSSISEPFGLTALEAAANDTSLLISKQSGVGEVLNNILRYDYWDEQALADRLVNLASSTALRDELSRGVAKEFNRFSWSDVAKRCMRQYERAVAAI